MIDFEIENKLRPFLSTDERLLWTGKPKTGIKLRRSDAFVIPFSLLWGGFAVFWESMAMAMNAPIFFKLWGIPFVLIGVYMIIGRFFFDAWKRAHTLYAITSDRIIIQSGIFSKDIQSLHIRTLSNITFTQKTDDSGTITLGPVDSRYKAIEGMDFPGAKQPPRLDMIEDVKNVYDKIISLQNRQNS